MLKAIRKFNDPVLSKVCSPVIVGEHSDLVRQICQDLRDTLRRYKTGVGLAANQIGYTSRIILVKDTIMINPVLVEKEGEQAFVEGCLSFPGKNVKTKRPAQVTVTYIDENFEQVTAVADGVEAVIVCHEMDHLNGICVVGSKKKVAA